MNPYEKNPELDRKLKAMFNPNAQKAEQAERMDAALARAIEIEVDAKESEIAQKKRVGAMKEI